ncbi:MAG: hypothetical protein LBC85_10140 [Fibromonadaceae bacterium]|jgi:hypothetical protein|nr:hypothetical protein [Fibromonadaceae bacterium]
MRKILVILLVFMVATAAFGQRGSTATNKVKSKRGDIQLTDASGGGRLVCQASFNDEMTILRREANHTLVRAACGQGWVNNADVEMVAAGPGDRGMSLDAVDVVGWIDNPSAVFVLELDANAFDGINIDRNFNDYLRNTLDREQTEMRNQEN